MQASFTVEFASTIQAKKAFESLKAGEISKKGSTRMILKAKAIRVEIKSPTFTGLRALSSSFLRNAKIVYDVIIQLEKK